ncbi:MAG: hypothetical protein WAT17_03930 [Candidatus Saccharimonadales bacterium]|jgi:hypothetical protein
MGTPRRSSTTSSLLARMLVDGVRPNATEAAKHGLDRKMFLAAMKKLRPHLDRMRGHQALADQGRVANSAVNAARETLAAHPAARRVWRVADWAQSPGLFRASDNFSVTIYLAMSGEWLVVDSVGVAYVFTTDEELLAYFSECLVTMRLRNTYKPSCVIPSLALELVESLRREVSISNDRRDEDAKKGRDVEQALREIVSRVTSS